MQDASAMCESWAEAGECDKNPDYMRGDMSSGLGSCRRSCGAQNFFSGSEQTFLPFIPIRSLRDKSREKG